MDAVVSSFNALEMKDAGPLFLAWAVFVCLVMSLSGSEENSVLMVCSSFCLFSMETYQCGLFIVLLSFDVRILIMLATSAKLLKLHH